MGRRRTRRVKGKSAKKCLTRRHKKVKRRTRKSKLQKGG